MADDGYITSEQYNTAKQAGMPKTQESQTKQVYGRGARGGGGMPARSAAADGLRSLAGLPKKDFEAASIP